MHKLQKEILQMLNKRTCSYSELYKPLNVRSNLFDYHLHKLIQNGLVIKSGKKYKLSSIGQSLSLYLEFERQPILATVLAVFKDDKVVLVKRDKHAFKGYWAIPGGKIGFGETIEQAAQRICCDETGLQPQSVKYVTTVQEFVKENNNKKYHFVMFLFRVKAEGKLKNGKLFSLENLPKKIVPSDVKMLKLTKSRLATSIIEENKTHLKQEIFLQQMF